MAKGTFHIAQFSPLVSPGEGTCLAKFSKPCVKGPSSLPFPTRHMGLTSSDKRVRRGAWVRGQDEKENGRRSSWLNCIPPKFIY